jgi:hypothetical protein
MASVILNPAVFGAGATACPELRAELPDINPKIKRQDPTERASKTEPRPDFPLPVGTQAVF